MSTPDAARAHGPAGTAPEAGAPAPASLQPTERPRSLRAYGELLERGGVLAAQRLGGEDPLIAHVSCDSRDVQPGTLFICKGAAFRPAYLEAALAAGAVAYVAESPIAGIGAPMLEVTDIRQAMGMLADAAWDHPSGRIAVCAVTGTRGKTTTAFCLRSILDARAERLGRARCPLFSTIVLDDGTTAEPAALTTPEPLDLQRHIACAASTGADALVMEASSQALKYGRMEGVGVAVGAFLNISEDHISPIEHPTFEDYLASKLRLFQHARCAVVNRDMDPAYLPRVLEAAREHCERVVSFSLADEQADVRATRIRHEAGGLAFDLTVAGETLPVRLSLLGAYNVENALAAVACAHLLGATAGDVQRGLSRVSVSGRMEIPFADEDLTVIVDYAHNGGSLDALLGDVRAAYPGRTITCLFGATGTKGVERRFGMGEAAGRLADRVIITEDDPGQEDPARICAQIADAVASAARSCGRVVPARTILDRTEAIAHALETAPRPGVLVLAGKGHEQFIIRGTAHEPYIGDAATVRRIMAGDPR